METRKRIVVTPQMFSCIRTLLDAKAPYAEISRYLGVSHSVISKVTACETFEEYQALLATYSQRQKASYARKAAAKTTSQKRSEEETIPDNDEPVKGTVANGNESRQTVIVQASHYMLEEQKRTNELLTSISNKLAFIVEELTGTKAEVTKDE